MEHLKSDDSFTEVGIIGHSEGSLIGMVAAERASTVSFISMVGAKRPIEKSRPRERNNSKRF